MQWRGAAGDTAGIEGASWFFTDAELVYVMDVSVSEAQLEAATGDAAAAEAAAAEAAAAEAAARASSGGSAGAAKGGARRHEAVLRITTKVCVPRRVRGPRPRSAGAVRRLSATQSEPSAPAAAAVARPCLQMCWPRL